MIVPFDFGHPATYVRIAIGCVWLLFGLVFKALDGLPRHRAIVARVLGEEHATLVKNLVALGEVGIGLWMLSGHHLRACMALQTAAILAMNALELRYARDLLVAPRAMVVANAALLAAGWYAAMVGS